MVRYLPVGTAGLQSLRDSVQGNERAPTESTAD